MGTKMYPVLSSSANHDITMPLKCLNRFASYIYKANPHWLQLFMQFVLCHASGNAACLAPLHSVEAQWLSGRMPDSRSREYHHESPTY